LPQQDQKNLVAKVVKNTEWDNCRTVGPLNVRCLFQ
jgi:hypothetical protein